MNLNSIFCYTNNKRLSKRSQFTSCLFPTGCLAQNVYRYFILMLTKKDCFLVNVCLFQKDIVL